MEKQGQILTINPMGVFVDDKPVTQYNGRDIRAMDKFNMGLVGGILEIQVMQSDLEGKYAMVGNPKPDFDGRYTWLRAKKDDGVWSDWLFRSDYGPLRYGTSLLKQNILADTFILASSKRRDFYNALRADIEFKRQKLLGMKNAADVNNPVK